MADDVAAAGVNPDGWFIDTGGVGDQKKAVARMETTGDLAAVSEDGTADGGAELLGARRRVCVHDLLQPRHPGARNGYKILRRRAVRSEPSPRTWCH
jgi:hypothetical protein